MDILKAFLALLAFTLLFVSFFTHGRFRFMLVITSLIIGVTNLFIPANTPKEELYAQRIEIIKKAKDSTDPDVIKMVEEVRADIAKEEAEKQTSETAEQVPKSFVVFMSILFSIALCSFIFYVTL